MPARWPSSRCRCAFTSAGSTTASTGETTASVSFVHDGVTEAVGGVVMMIRAGNAKAINALKGAVMKLSAGKANPKLVDEILKRQLGVV